MAATTAQATAPGASKRFDAAAFSTVALRPARRRYRRTAAFVLVLVVFATAWGNGRHAADARSGTLASVGQQPSSHVPGRFRVATFNIATGHRRDGGVDLAAVARALHGIDVAALQEVDGPWIAYRDNQADDLADHLSLAAAFAPTERRWWQDHMGNALLTRFNVAPWQSIPLPCTQRRGFRNLLFATLPTESGKPLKVLVAHIDRRQDREAQLEIVCNLFESLAEPAMLLGDLNTTRDDPRLATCFGRGARDALDDAGAGSSERRIDWILLRGLRGTAGGEVREEVSDHPLYWADVELMGPATTQPGE
ncbi:MAG: endonuclease/exonuclease/phosphatase family protein [Pirellulales bacterium]|nr:endonuclease/exonuclease/phosphatase family protein [Pirellulales bacterium]